MLPVFAPTYLISWPPLVITILILKPTPVAKETVPVVQSEFTL
jgi:hypothetical protein